MPVPDFWIRVVTSKIIRVLSVIKTKERQLEFLQDIIFFINKLKREIQLNGKL
jgi:hypothetical protein